MQLLRAAIMGKKEVLFNTWYLHLCCLFFPIFFLLVGSEILVDQLLKVLYIIVCSCAGNWSA